MKLAFLDKSDMYLNFFFQKLCIIVVPLSLNLSLDIDLYHSEFFIYVYVNIGSRACKFRVI